MVSSLKYFASDPQKKGRGSGQYYYRGAVKVGNKRIKTWSKYSGKADAKIHSPKTKVKNVAKAELKMPHKGDYGVKHRGNTKGWF